MSKILKARNINVDSDNKFDINKPILDSSELLAAAAVSSDNMEPVKFDGYENFDGLTEDFNSSEDSSAEDILNHANRQAEEIIADAKNEAKRIVSKARENAEEERLETLENAQKSGYEQGYNSALAEVQSMKEEAEEILQNAHVEREEMIQSVEREMIDLVVNVSEKIIGKTLEINPQIILALIKQGLSQTSVTGELFIKVSEDDYKDVCEHKEEFFALTDGSTNIEITKDFLLSKGDCIIETPFGNIDCSISQQFDGLKQSLYYILENR